MNELLMAPELYHFAVKGYKRITIRLGLRDFAPGEVIRIVNAEDDTQSFEVVVMAVHQYRFANRIPRKYLVRDRFDDRDEFFMGMRKFYPDFSEVDPVTIIEWRIE